MEDPPIAIHTRQNPKKRFYSGNSNGGGGSGSLSFSDPDVIEIPPPPSWKSKPLRGKSKLAHEVIVVDDDDSDDTMIIDEKFAHKSEGKKPIIIHLDGNVSANDEVSCPHANGFIKGNTSIIEDDFSRMSSFDQECAMLQEYFDTVDIQAGIEATVPWWPLSSAIAKQAVSTTNSSVLGTLASSNNGVSDGESWSFPEPLQSKKSLSKFIHHELKLPLPSPEDQTYYNFHMPTSSTSPAMPLPPSSTSPAKPSWLPAAAHSHKKLAAWSTSCKLPFGATKDFLGFQNTHQGYEIPFAGHHMGISPPNKFLPTHNMFNPAVRLDDSISAGIKPLFTEGQDGTSENPFSKKLEVFKKFDCLEDHSGHFYDNKRESCNQSSSWKKKIHAEWRMLERDLPAVSNLSFNFSGLTRFEPSQI